MSELAADTGERFTRFRVAFHKTRAAVYLLTIPMGILASLAGMPTVSATYVVAATSAGAVAALLFVLIYARGWNRFVSFDLSPVWLAADVVFITWGVYATGGIQSHWYIWYLSNSTSAAFVSGRRAALAVILANTTAYLATLAAMGQFEGSLSNFGSAFLRMAFLGVASWFVHLGIANSREKRIEIRRMKNEEEKKVEELMRLTHELHEKSDELVEANLRIREADRLKSQFLANMSHELRTPMNSIIGFSEILLEKLDGRVEPKELNFLRHILVSGQHLLSIINDVLDLSKIEAGKMELFPEMVGVRGSIESVCSVMRGSASKDRYLFVIDVPDALPQVETDPAKLKQVLYNLIANAVKFSPPQSTITIEARESSLPDGTPAVSISVTDQGIGIAPENHRMIWEEFRQVDASSRREFAGTGLGLALVRKFVELQKGAVAVDSALGKGSTFTVTLPQRFRGIVTGSAAVVQSPVRTGHRILVVEDDAAAWAVISSQLQAAAYIPIRARHGEEAIRLARTVRPVAITLDLVLPGLDGWEVLKQLKMDARTRDIPVLIVSIIDNRELAVALGADDYFLKPVDRERLVQRLRQLGVNADLPTGSRRLLLIDDDPAIHDLVGTELLGSGFDLSNAFNGREGIDKARAQSPDIIVLDLVMPDMSGFEVADNLKGHAETSHIPILILTSKDLTRSDKEQLQSKIAALVPKGQTSGSRLMGAIRQITH